jgi:hypothetical protein
MAAALCERAASCASACGAGVPPLPPITSVMGPSYRNYTWMYDKNFVIRSYSFSNLDWVPARPAACPTPARAHAPRATEAGPLAALLRPGGLHSVSAVFCRAGSRSALLGCTGADRAAAVPQVTMSNIAARSNLYWCAWRRGRQCVMRGVSSARHRRTRCGRDVPAPPRRVHLITIWVVTFYTYSVRGRPSRAGLPGSAVPNTASSGCATAYKPCAGSAAPPAAGAGRPLTREGRARAQLLWRYSREAVQMRLRYLQTEQGAEAHTVLVQDIPGVSYGTPLHRLDATVLAVLPGAVKNPAKRYIGRAVSLGEKGVQATAGKLANTLITTRCAPPLPAAGPLPAACVQDMLQAKPYWSPAIQYHQCQ